MKLLFTGDICIEKPRSDNMFDTELVEYIKKNDLACCNLEGAIKQKMENSKIGPCVYNSEKTIDMCSDAGFKLFALANNHIYDYKKTGVDETIRRINENNCQYIGIDENNQIKSYEILKNNLKLSIYNVAENGFGCSSCAEKGFYWFKDPRLEEDIIHKYKSGHKIIIISHAGAEYFDYPLPEIRNLYRHWIDLGVSCVIGHHPHVPQGFENYKNGKIYYSLGNFIFDEGGKSKTSRTFSVSIDIDLSGNFSYEEIYTVYNDGKIYLDKDDSLKKKINEINKVMSNNENYEKEVNYFCTEAYNKFYRDYYGKVRVLTSLYNKMFRKKNLYDKWIFHNLVIETHYWVCRRAMILAEKEKQYE